MTTQGPPFIFPNGTRMPNADSVTVTVPRFLPGVEGRVPVEVTGLRCVAPSVTTICKQRLCSTVLYSVLMLL
jgi:hypothetical protein